MYALSLNTKHPLTACTYDWLLY